MTSPGKLKLSIIQKLRRYHVLQSESKLAESKLKSAESAQEKLQAPRKRASVKRAKNADKLREKVMIFYFFEIMWHCVQAFMIVCLVCSGVAYKVDVI